MSALRVKIPERPHSSESHCRPTGPKILPFTTDKNTKHLTELDHFRFAKLDKKVLCRLCEEEISTSLLKEHSKFCVIANTWDMIALSEDEQLHKVSQVVKNFVDFFRSPKF
jgi:hypothetical protein